MERTRGNDSGRRRRRQKQRIGQRERERESERERERTKNGLWRDTVREGEEEDKIQSRK